MNWKPIDDPNLLRALLDSSPIATRLIAFDLKSSPMAFASARDVDAFKYAEAEKKFAIQIYGTSPAAALVEDLNLEKVIAAYAWNGGGGPIASSRDSRVVQLADALEAEHLGIAPSEHWHHPEIVSLLSGMKVNPAASGPPLGFEASYGDGVRESSELATFDQLKEYMANHCTDAQCATVLRLTQKKGHQLNGAVNVRKHGDHAIGTIRPVLVDKFGQYWVVLENGIVERVGDGEERSSHADNVG